MHEWHSTGCGEPPHLPAQHGHQWSVHHLDHDPLIVLCRCPWSFLPCLPLPLWIQCPGMYKHTYDITHTHACTHTYVHLFIKADSISMHSWERNGCKFRIMTLRPDHPLKAWKNKSHKAVDNKLTTTQCIFISSCAISY